MDFSLRVAGRRSHLAREFAEAVDEARHAKEGLHEAAETILLAG